MPDTTARYEALVKGLYTPDIPTPSAWVGQRAGALPIEYENAELSSSPQEMQGRRQGSEDDPNNRRRGPTRQQGEANGITWVYAPSTSHISRFALVTENDETRLQVVFKGPNGNGEVAEFAYYPSAATARALYDQMRRSQHPYGTVLYPQAIKTGIPYHRISGG